MLCIETQASYKPLLALQSKTRAIHDQAFASSTAAYSKPPATLNHEKVLYSPSQHHLRSKAACPDVDQVPLQHISWGLEQKPGIQPNLGAELQPPATPEPLSGPRSCTLPHVKGATMTRTNGSQGTSFPPAAPGVVNVPFSQTSKASFDAMMMRSDDAWQPAQSPIIQSDRVSPGFGTWCSSSSQSGRTLDRPSALGGYQNLADDSGAAASRHPAFSRHSRGQAWARCNSAPGPGPPPAPLSFCWQQGHLPDIYQHTSLSPSRLMAQAHRGGQGAKGCLAW